MITRLFGFMATVLLAIQPAIADTLLWQIGDPPPPLVLKDPFDQPQSLPSDTVYLLFSAEKQTSTWATHWLDQQTPAYLAHRHIVYVADIHKMPSLITRFIALPELRDKTYPVLLGYEATDVQALPRQAGCLSLFTLQDGKLQQIHYICQADELEHHLVP